ncbi:MAG: hypothetical protein KF858_05055 [Candidatus Sumerlaeia bacterium]|nr:hypothetical protein [Candidatus Sumerlaeia bacterium]
MGKPKKAEEVIQDPPLAYRKIQEKAMTMAKTIDNKKDVVLLLLYSPGASGNFNEPVVGRTRLVKMLFVFYKEWLKHFKRGTKITEENFYRFFAWNFGPFSKEVYDDLMFFILRGFIDREESTAEVLPEAAAEWDEWMNMSTSEAEDGGFSEYEEQEFRLSEKGLRFAKELYDSLSPEQRTTLKTFKTKMNTASLRAILKYVYETYPDFTTQSQIRSKVLGRP